MSDEPERDKLYVGARRVAVALAIGAVIILLVVSIFALTTIREDNFEGAGPVAQEGGKS